MLIRSNLKTYGLGPQKAFESLCNQIFEEWTKSEYGDQVSYFTTVRGDGGDGGVESYAELKDGTFLGLQAKWFDRLENSQISQIRKSIHSALRVRPQMRHYIVSLPMDLTSDKISKGEKVTKNTEEGRWLALKAEISAIYQGLSLELWNEHQLITHLQRDKLQGAKHFWLGMEAITFDLLKNQFNNAKASWLKQRYLPDLHATGQIYRTCSFLMRSNKAKGTILAELDGMGVLSEKLQRELDTFQRFLKKDLDPPLKTLLNFVVQIKAYIEPNLEKVENNLDIGPFETEDQTDYRTLFAQLGGLDTDSTFHSLSYDLPPLVEEFYNLNPADFLRDIILRWNSTYKIFAGHPGTGKTHAVAHISETLLAAGIPALLIQAKSVPDPSSWKTILQHALGLGTDWSEDDLLNALTARTNILEIEKSYSAPNEQHFSFFLICLDGLDETDNWDAWTARVQEIEQFAIDHPRLRFIVTSRPYMLKDTSLTEALPTKITILTPEGDIPVHKVFDAYMQRFQIDVTRVPWVRWNIRSLLALRIFCELNKGRTFGPNDQVSTTLGALLRDRVKSAEGEILNELGKGIIGPNKFLKCLLAIAVELLNKGDIKHDELHAMVKQKMSLDDTNATKLIQCLVDRAMFISVNKGYKSALQPGEIFYQPAYQSVIETLIAIELASLAHADESIPNHLLQEGGILEIAATLIFVDKNTLPASDAMWGNQLTEDTINRLRCTALSSCQPEQAANYKDWVGGLLKESMPKSRFVLANLCYPVARIPQHPLGPLLVHEVLLSYKTPAERDLIWSGLDQIPHNQGAIWEGYGPNPIREEAYTLDEEDLFDGLPLLHAWNLTSIDNGIVDRCSKNLTEWGAKKPSEFIKLFKLLMPTNDPQLNEMVVCCAYGITSVLKPGKIVFVQDMANWLLENVFTQQGLKRYRSSIIRGTGRAIVERAFQLGLTSAEEVQRTRPPFSLRFEMLPLDKAAAQASESYGPIWHDLAWYVIKNGYCGFFEPKQERISSAHSESELIHPRLNVSELEYVLSEKLGTLADQEKETLKKHLALHHQEQKIREDVRIHFAEEQRALLLKIPEAKGKHATEKEIPAPTQFYYEDAARVLEEANKILGFIVDPHQLALSTAYKFIEDLGWTAQTFKGHPNGGQEGEIIGADLAITRKHFMASHGARSKRMSFGEKYVWAAVHHLQGFFSDYIEHSSFGGDRKRVSDYSLIEDFPNPAQLIVPKYSSDHKRKKFIIPCNLSPAAPEISGDLKLGISKWVQEAEIPDLSQVIFPDSKFTNHLVENREMTLIHSLMSIGDLTGLARSLLWLDMLLIEQDDWPKVRTNLVPDNCFLRELIEDVYRGLTTKIECDCYTSPRDVIFQNWKKEIEPQIVLSVVNSGKLGSIFLSKCVCEVTARSTDHGERHFTLPSKILRNGLGIVLGDGTQYFDAQDYLIAISTDAGSSFKDSQDNLYVDRQLLLKFTNAKNKVPIWLVRLDRQQSTKAFSTIGRVNPEISHYYLFYLDNGSLSQFSFDPDFRP